MLRLYSIGLFVLCLIAGQAFAATVVGTWKLDNLPQSQLIRFQVKEKPIAVIPRARLARVKEVLGKIEAAAGVSTESFLMQLSDNTPNAFAKVTDDGRKIVGITPAMVELLGDDSDAYAAIFGHELAHITKEHGATRTARRGFLQGLGLIAGVVIGATTGVNVSSLINLGSTLVNTAFSREEEREADKIGIDYMVAAGFDPEGAIRAHEKMLSRKKISPVPFLSTHPGGEERIASFREIVARLPPKPPVMVAARVSSDKSLLMSVGDFKVYVMEINRAAQDVAEVRTRIEETDGQKQDDSWSVMCSSRTVYWRGATQFDSSGSVVDARKPQAPSIVYLDSDAPGAIVARPLVDSVCQGSTASVAK